jgi:hypothetical protein
MIKQMDTLSNTQCQLKVMYGRAMGSQAYQERVGDIITAMATTECTDLRDRNAPDQDSPARQIGDTNPSLLPFPGSSHVK